MICKTEVKVTRDMIYFLKMFVLLKNFFRKVSNRSIRPFSGLYKILKLCFTILDIISTETDFGALQLILKSYLICFLKNLWMYTDTPSSLLWFLIGECFYNLVIHNLNCKYLSHLPRSPRSK